MSTLEELRELELVINRWSRHVLGLVSDLDFQRTRVTVSVGIHRGTAVIPPRGEIIIRISPVTV